MAEPSGEAESVGAGRGRPAPRIEDFLDPPTRDLEAWRWLWAGTTVPRPQTAARGRVLCSPAAVAAVVQVPQTTCVRQRIFTYPARAVAGGVEARHLETGGRVESSRPEGPTGVRPTTPSCPSDGKSATAPRPLFALLVASACSPPTERRRRGGYRRTAAEQGGGSSRAPVAPRRAGTSFAEAATFSSSVAIAAR